MRQWTAGLLIGVVATTLIVGYPQVWAQRPTNFGERSSASDSLVALSFDLGEGRQQVTVVDPKTRVLAVYHIDRATGALTLRSVRQAHWDLQMDEFNSGSPTPREIRALAERR